MRSIKYALRGFCLLIAVLLLTSMASSMTPARAQAQENAGPIAYNDPQRAPYERLLAASQTPAVVDFRVGGFPRLILGSFPVSGTNQVERAKDFVQQHRDLLLQEHPDLALYVRTTVGMMETSEETIIFEQTYRGVKVEGAQLAVTVFGDTVYMASGSLLTSRMIADDDLDVRPALSFADARTRARAAVEDSDAPIPFSPELRIYYAALHDEEGSTQLRLVWRVVTEPEIVLLDAHSGETVRQMPRQPHMDLEIQHAHGTNSDSTGCYNFTWANESVADQDGVYEGWEDDVDIVAAREHGMAVWNYYNDTFNWTSLNDGDMQLEIFVYAALEATAQFAGGFGCNFIEVGPGNVAFDVIAHEFAHGVSYYRDAGRLMDEWTTYEIEEGLGDILASLGDGDWLIGDERTGSMNVIHNLFDPTETQQPDRWTDYTMTVTEEHLNGGIISRAASLMTDGGSFNNYTVEGIGFAKAQQLWWMILKYLPVGSTMPDLRNYGVAMAAVFAAPPPFLNGGNSLHGFTLQDVCDVRNAFAAIELGGGDENCDGVEEPNVNDADQDGVWGNDDNCPNHWNPAQDDWDGDGDGNVCDPLEALDEDQDGVPEACYDDVCGLPDNCPNVYNPEQTDANFNGVGAACDVTEDSDFDDDGMPNATDNCVFDPNPDQANVDADVDDLGDACDPDEDGDGWSNDNDNCVGSHNPDQMNSDNDPLGDACDICPTGDNTTGVAEGYIDVNPYDDEPGEIVYYYDEETYTCSESVSRPDMEGFPVLDAGGILSSDCQPYDITITANPGNYETLPINMSGQPIDWYPRGAFMTVTLNGLPEGVYTWIQDSDGRSFGGTHAPGARVMRARPLGGQNYALGMAFREDMTAGEAITFSGQIAVEYGGVQLCAPMAAEPVDVTLVPPVATPVPTNAPTSAPTLPPPPPPTVTPDLCGTFRLTSPSGGMTNSPMTFYWDPAPAAQFYRINIIDGDTNTVLFQGDSPAPNTNAVIDVSTDAIGGGNNLRVDMQAFANGTVICTSSVPQQRESAPAAPAPGGQCSITMVGEALVYQIPVVDSANIFDELQPGAQSAVIGRLGDNSWWKLAYNNTWIEMGLVSSQATTSGDCSNLPVVSP